MICLRNLFQLSPTRHISHERHRNQLNLFPIGATPPPPPSLPANLHWLCMCRVIYSQYVKELFNYEQHWLNLPAFHVLQNIYYSTRYLFQSAPFFWDTLYDNRTLHHFCRIRVCPPTNLIDLTLSSTKYIY